jgi:carboxypeptidase Taq
MPPRESYDWLRAHAVETAYIGSALALLHWDQSTKMPAAGHAHRAAQVASLTGLLHARRTDPRVGEALAKARAELLRDDPHSELAANVREWQRAYDRAVRIPADLAVATARAAALGETAWQRARPGSDWRSFLPYLEEIVRLRREEAEAVGYAGEPYDALLDEYEPGETAAGLEPVLAGLRRELVPLLDRILGAPRRPDRTLLSRHVPLEAQRALCREAAAAIGFDFEAGRLDSTAHPFSTRIGPGDVRITTRYNEHAFDEALFGAIHEAGHALHSQGIPGAHFGTPCGVSVSLGVHESQSRLWENMVARSRGFWRHFLPRAAGHVAALEGVALDDLVLAVNAVRPSLIRTEADEVTYNLHVLLRFGLELALLRGQLQPRDLPGAWDEAMRSLLGLTPPELADGVMQDVHWAAGLVGYFPTYTLGNLYAAQLFEAAGRELGGGAQGLDERFAAGEFASLLDWLRAKVHVHGSRYAPRELMRRATGAELDHGAFMRYLTAKYEALYGL